MKNTSLPLLLSASSMTLCYFCTDNAQDLSTNSILMMNTYSQIHNQACLWIGNVSGLLLLLKSASLRTLNNRRFDCFGQFWHLSCWFGFYKQYACCFWFHYVKDFPMLKKIFCQFYSTFHKKWFWGHSDS